MSKQTGIEKIILKNELLRIVVQSTDNRITDGFERRKLILVYDILKMDDFGTWRQQAALLTK